MRARNSLPTAVLGTAPPFSLVCVVASATSRHRVARKRNQERKAMKLFGSASRNAHSAAPMAPSHDIDQSPKMRLIALGAVAATVATSFLVATAAPSSADTVTHGLGLLKPAVKIAAKAPMTAIAAPTSVDLTPYAVPVGDQGQVGSCVAWAIAHGMMGWYANKYGMPTNDFAPMYMYSQINVGKSYSPPQDQGSYPTDGMSLASTQGDDASSDYGQGAYDWTTQPTAAQHANAANYKLTGYTTLFANDAGLGGSALQVSIQNALAAGQPVAIGFPVRPGFDALSTTNLLDTDTTGPIRGYHEVLALGYDANGLLIQNQWGTAWGNHGYGRLGWNVVTNDIIEADVANGWASPAIANTKAVSTSATQENITATVRSATSNSVNVNLKYGLTTSYGSSITTYFAPTLTSSGWVADLNASLSNLVPQSTYHYKLTVTSSLGTATYPDATFTSSAPRILTNTSVEPYGYLDTAGVLQSCVSFKYSAPAGGPTPTQVRVFTSGVDQYFPYNPATAINICGLQSDQTYCILYVPYYNTTQGEASVFFPKTPVGTTGQPTNLVVDPRVNPGPAAFTWSAPNAPVNGGTLLGYSGVLQNLDDPTWPTSYLNNVTSTAWYYYGLPRNKHFKLTITANWNRAVPGVTSISKTFVTPTT
jgi:C1A family cysteine protease